MSVRLRLRRAYIRSLMALTVWFRVNPHLPLALRAFFGCGGALPDPLLRCSRAGTTPPPPPPYPPPDCAAQAIKGEPDMATLATQLDASPQLAPIKAVLSTPNITRTFLAPTDTVSARAGGTGRVCLACACVCECVCVC